MKSTVLASALAAGILVGTTSGRPLTNKRALVTEVVYVTETVANVAVYVDENGAPYSTTTASYASAVFTTSVAVQPTSESAAASSVSSSSSKPVAPPSPSPVLPSFTVPTPSLVVEDKPSTSAAPAPSSTTSVEAQVATTSPPPAPTTTAPAPPPAPTSTTPAPPPPAPTSTAPAPPPPAASSDVPAQAQDSSSLGMGVTYDPFTGGRGSADCKSKDQMAQDFNRMKDFKTIRIYANDCNVFPVAVQNAVKNGQKLLAGAYMTHQSNSEDLTTNIKALKSAVDQYANGKWDVIALYSVENERVNEHDMTASDVVAAINDARKQLRGVGYNGPVGAVETVPAMVENPAICEASDVVMVNCHAFFDRNTVSSDAGTFVKSQVGMVKDKCSGKRVVVTESGWPHQGDTNGQAVASPEDQKAALASLRQNFDSDIFLFSAFDSLWKSDSASTFNAEQYWGIMR